MFTSPWHGNTASTLMFMPGDVLQLLAASLLPARSPALPWLLLALAFGMALLGEVRKGTWVLLSYCCAALHKASLPAAEGMEGRSTGQGSRAEMLNGAEQAMG